MPKYSIHNLSPFKFINKHLKFLLLFTSPHLKQLELPRDLKALGKTVLLPLFQF